MRFNKAISFILVLLLSLCFTAKKSQAQELTSRSEYYSIEEVSADATLQNMPPTEVYALPAEMNLLRMLKSAKLIVLNLLNWTLHAEARPQPEEKYIRKLHFGRWINDPNDNRCMNTRAHVLVRDSEDEVTFRNNKNCVVDTGKWLDPYSGNLYVAARDIQIDHMVPLKHAYVSGAWQWDYKTRCLFANYMGYKNHLVPSSVRENTSKGDRAPDKYLPTNVAYRCAYVKDWLAIKLIWRLTMTSEEVQAIQDVIDSENCSPNDFAVTDKDLQDQRQYINDNIESCMSNKN